MIKTKFSFLQMPVKGGFGNPIEFEQTAFCIAPKTFNAIDMTMARGKFIFLMLNPEMFIITKIDQAVIATPAVSMENRLHLSFSANNGL